MTFLRRHWYNLGGLAAIVAIIAFALTWGVSSPAQKLLLANFIAIPFMFVALIKMTYSWPADRYSPYPFPPEEMTRFDVPGKLARLQVRSR